MGKIEELKEMNRRLEKLNLKLQKELDDEMLEIESRREYDMYYND